ncbi:MULTISPECIES: rod shape-determining protein MreC [Prevotella]|jgi:rod shape-determining protein MreC|uniref:Cell shape-determining protein MreC n=1 Tax=Prevotella pectinovora TaxID=1602169 RepID=A0A0D0HA71_9BACT|nr:MULTISPECIES: rod shape-determining protein MreC [Prevotella]KIP54546.1 rod shape-determining protein MreC [Prevotella pectinovora]KIP59006.1 rod shape-determining protein MreC [Prevotella pectinovora]KIP60057.1 rod shape-determining protein MreC [Prevotella pectinovora]MCI6048576.1 rod shape-determining protein MreC [Prevotella pectinovora]MDD7744410.1 rod shape-determining protein MreC [Prevotella pectinovora]
MRNLLAFLAKYNHWFVFILLEVICFVLLFRFNNFQGSVYFSSANAVAGKVYEYNSSVTTFFNMSQSNKKLSERNLILEQQVRALTQYIATHHGDSLAMEQCQKQALAGFKLIPAKVIQSTINREDNLITIDKGKADGIHEDMGVACGTGVVGVVYMASDHYSIVLPVINVNSNISVMIRKRGYFGFLHWKGTPSDIAYVDDVPRHARFALGDYVVTNGYSSIFPPGIMVGKILHVFNSSDGLSYRVQLRLSTDFGKLRHVCVIDNSALKDKALLLKAAQDSLKPRDTSKK